MVKVNLTQIYRKSLRCFIAKYYIFCYNRIINFCFGGPRDGCFIQQALEIADQQENEQSGAAQNGWNCAQHHDKVKPG